MSQELSLSDIQNKRATMSMPIHNPIYIEIDPAGDVILNVRDTCKLRVSTKILSLASKPFAAMFGPKYREGMHLDVHQPPTVDLPEDCPITMSWICRKLHYEDRIDINSPSPLSCEQLLNVAICMEKYDLVAAINVYFKDEIEHYLSDNIKVSGVDRFRLLTAAYILGNRSLFRKISRSILSYGEGISSAIEFIKEESESITERMPALVYVTMTETAANLQRHFSNKLIQLMNSWENGAIMWDACRRISFPDGRGSEPKFSNFSFWYGLIHPPFTGKGSYMEAMSIDVDAYLSRWVLEIENDQTSINSTKFAIELKDLVYETVRYIPGLCLDCMRLAGTGLKWCDVCETQKWDHDMLYAYK